MSTTATANSNLIQDPTQVLAGLAVQFGLTIAISAGCLILFEFLRLKYPWIYSPKYCRDKPVAFEKPSSKRKNQRFTNRDGSKDEEQNHRSLYNPGQKFFSWIRPTLHSGDSLLGTHAGLEATMFSKFMSFSTKYFMILSLFSLVFLIPINVVMGTFKAEDKSGFGLHTLSIASIPNGHTLLWVPAVMTTFFTVIAIYSFWKFWKDFAVLREAYLDHLAHNHDLFMRTILITDVPEGYRSEAQIAEAVDKTLKEIIEQDCYHEFKDRIYGEQKNRNTKGFQESAVDHVVLDRKVEDIATILEKRNKDLSILEHRLVEFVKELNAKRNDLGEEEAYDGSLLKLNSSAERLNKKDEDAESQTAKIGMLSMFKSWYSHNKAEKSVRTIADIVSAKKQILGQNVPVAALIKLTHKLEKRGLFYFTETKEQKRICCGRPKVIPSISDLAKEIEESDKTINNARCQQRDYELKKDSILSQKFLSLHPAQSAVLVTLKTGEAAALLSKCGSIKLNSDEFITSQCDSAPQPSDIHWNNLSVSSRKRRSRSFFVNTFVAALVIFYLLPVTAIIGLTNLENLAKNNPSLSVYLKNVWFVAFIQQVVPTMLLSLFMVLLQYILTYLSKFEKPRSFSDQERGVMSKYFYFELFNVLFAFSIGSSLFDVVTGLLRNAENVIRLLAITMPQNAAFFLNYVVLCTSFFSVELLQVFQIVQEFFFFWFVDSKTPRSIFKLKNRNLVVDYSYWYPSVVLTFIIGSVYSAIYPIITVFCFVYFFVGNLIFRYQFLYVYTQQYETVQGLFSSFAFSKVILGILLQQITMFCFLLLKEAYLAAGLLLFPTFCVTVFFHFVIKRKFRGNIKTWGSYLVERMTREKPAFSDSSDSDTSTGDLLSSVNEASEEKESLENHSSKNYTNPVFTQPLKHLWLPAKTKQRILELIEENKKQSK